MKAQPISVMIHKCQLTYISSSCDPSILINLCKFSSIPLMSIYITHKKWWTHNSLKRWAPTY